MTPALRFLSNQVWALHPPVFDLLAALFERRANGESVRRTDGTAGTAEPQPEIIGDTAVVSVRGVLARYADQINGECQDQGRSAEHLQRDLLAVAGNPRVKRIVLRIDSPGGTVAGTAETGAVIRQISASGKLVVAFVDGMAASAAYWLASQADEIVMGGPTTEVGSIGVITAHVDATLSNEAEGFRVQVFRTSPLKAPGAFGEALNAEQAASIHRDLADFHAAFTDAVRAGRGLDDAQLAAVTSGELWRPQAAIAKGLADRVATFAELIGSSSVSSVSPPSSTPAVSAAKPKESTMDPKLMAALAALSDTHPTLAAQLVASANKPGATAETLQALVTEAQGKAKDEQLAAATAQLAAAQKTHTEAIAAKDAEIAKLTKIAGLAKGAGNDPGSGAGSARRRSEMSRSEKAAYVRDHGQPAYDALAY
jgi:capsid assembly protease